MKTKSRQFLLIATLLVSMSFAAQAQRLYRSIGPDGKVTYSDVPPPKGQIVAVTPVNRITGTSQNAQNQIDVTALPSEVRKAYNTYPVTFYTSKDCQACDMGRAHLQTRGIPYLEITVYTNKDREAFKQKIPSATGFPVTVIGAKVLSGFNNVDWDSYLDAAGYPKTSQLPSSYQNPVAQPMTQPDTEEEQNAPNNPLPVIRPITPTPATPVDNSTTNNPTGIRF